MNTTLTQVEVFNHVKILTKRFLSENTNQVSFIYTTSEKYIFQTAEPNPHDKFSPWNLFLAELQNIGVRAFSFACKHNELYFISPVISAVPSYIVNKSAIESIKAVYSESYFQTLAFDSTDLTETQKIGSKIFYPQSQSSDDLFAHELGKSFGYLTYNETKKVSEVIRGLGITSMYYSG